MFHEYAQSQIVINKKHKILTLEFLSPEINLTPLPPSHSTHTHTCIYTHIYVCVCALSVCACVCNIVALSGLVVGNISN